MPTQLLDIINILGTISFAVSGAFMAMNKKLDPFGVMVISFVTAIGGGTLRDLLIGNLPVSWLQNPTTSIIIFCSATVAMFFGKFLRHLSTTLFLFDAIGLGLFTIVGLKMGIRAHFTTGICIALGTITACFGGVLRDVLLNNIPLLFRKEIYALACIIGGGLYMVLRRTDLPVEWNTIISIAAVFTVRLLAVLYKISLPQWYSNNSDRKP